MAKLLLVDDEEDLLTPLIYALEREGHACTVCATGAAALTALDGGPWDLVVLDLMLPDISGAEICRRIRLSPRTRQVPVIIVSARGDEFDRVVGFELGADDYVTKPFSLRELGLRVGALLRRSAAAPPTGERLAFADVVLDLDALQVSVAGEELDLTALEIRILECFLRAPGRALVRNEIRDRAWGTGYRIGERAVDTNIKRLRQKLGAAGRFIETVRGVGYRWASEA